MSLSTTSAHYMTSHVMSNKVSQTDYHSHASIYSRHCIKYLALFTTVTSLFQSQSLNVTLAYLTCDITHCIWLPQGASYPQQC